MTIDHFRPKSLFPDLYAEYVNLYYCCGECNTYKGDRWPSKEQLAGGSRFLDVCEDEWDVHLEIVRDVMTGKTAAGRYTVSQVRLDRDELTRRNRDLRVREERVRSDLRRIADIRGQLGTGADSLIARNLIELERSVEAQLREILSPTPLEG